MRLRILLMFIVLVVVIDVNFKMICNKLRLENIIRSDNFNF